jgi:hypothetical protein
MEKEFIPYEQALALKELGFDEPCFGYYDIKDNNLRLFFDNLQDASCNSDLKYDDFKHCTAPTFSQAFREKYEYISFIKGRKSMGFDYTLSDVPTNLSKRDTFQSPHVFETYEEAEQTCLIKLIEIVKNK